MKRVREEEGEEEQEQAAPVPMAVSPARNPGPAAAATSSGTSHGRVVTWDDAVDFVLSVKRTFDQAKYHEFLSIVRQVDSIGLRRVVDHVKVLFRGHSNLKTQFNMFQPEQYELSPREGD